MNARGQTDECDAHREANHTEHVGEVAEAFRPEEGSLEIDLEMQSSVNDVKDNGRQQSDEASDRHKRHGTKITEQRKRNHHDEVNRSPEVFTTSDFETPILPRKPR